jgi:hypothetical protein
MNYVYCPGWLARALLSRIARVWFRFRSAAPPELEHVPVEDIVVGEALPVEQVPEQLPQVTKQKL